MSGEGGPIAAKGYPFRNHRTLEQLAAEHLAVRMEERADTLAYLARKAENAKAIAARDAELREVAERDLRCIGVIAGDLQARMHEGEAAMAREFGRELTPFGDEG